MPTRRVLSWALAGILLLVGTGVTLAADPKVPPGRDPGGVAIAIVGQGLDYRRPELVSRVARDGEGELIGWDFADNDARPFASPAGDDRLADIVLAEGPGTRLVVARVAAGRDDQIAMALRFTADTPARLAFVAARPATAIPRGHLADAARHLARLLIVVPARSVAGALEPAGASEQVGLLVVAADGSTGQADVLVSLAARPGSPVGTAAAAGIVADDIAAARVAALAARLIATEPGLTGGALRARILSLARAAPKGAPVIQEITRGHGLE